MIEALLGRVTNMRNRREYLDLSTADQASIVAMPNDVSPEALRQAAAAALQEARAITSMCSGIYNDDVAIPVPTLSDLERTYVDVMSCHDELLSEYASEVAAEAMGAVQDMIDELLEASLDLTRIVAGTRARHLGDIKVKTRMLAGLLPEDKGIVEDLATSVCEDVAALDMTNGRVDG